MDFPIYLISQIGSPAHPETSELDAFHVPQIHKLLLNTLWSRVRLPVRTTCKDFRVPIVPDWIQPVGIPAEGWRERRQ